VTPGCRMANAPVTAGHVALLCSMVLVADLARGFGPDGHRIAGAIAERRICEAASAEIESLADGDGLGEIGLWPDWIRSEERWAHTGPWHYLNIGDAASLESYRHPEEGDVLWAIQHFRERLADRSLPEQRRREALSFLSHFVVDIHQPLHVGRASDRGGNTIRVRFGEDGTANLHRFWDSVAINLAGLSREAYVSSLLPLVAANATQWTSSEPLDWAQESKASRGRVYEFRRGDHRLERPYLEMAVDLTRRRLAQAGVRLALVINGALCSR